MPHSKITDSQVKKEFYDSTVKFHVIATWVGLILNLIWCISDFFIIRDHLYNFLTFRIVVSVGSALVLIFRKQLRVNIYTCMFLLVTGISVQNAYMWSVMDVQHLQQHSFAYMVLFIGVGMLVLWEIKLSIYLALITILSNVLFYLLNSHLKLEEFLINGGLITLTVVIFCIFLIRTRYRLTYNEIRIRLALEQSKKVIEQKHEEVLEQKKEIQSQKDTLEAKNREITDSISYAKSIQNALIPSEEKFKNTLNQSFVLFKPKDIVSGDFYWIYSKDNVVYYVTADCTGHGVPGGFMTMLGLTFLEQIIINQHVQNPAEVLDLMKEKLIKTLNKYGEVGDRKDGMDINVCRLDTTTNTLTFSAANNNLYVVRNVAESEEERLEVYKANRQPCGYYILDKPFTAETIQLNPGDCIYTFTDGYADQFGGPKGKKFRYKQFEQMLLKNSRLPMQEQNEILNATMIEWRGTHEQVDDILVIGVRV
ncbi:MAG: SpoIIE family protein phosphatase [Bacteroidia bacterium]|nr:SpoIIE family protein phosphatase [Bacteroidia bacterium]